MVDELIELNWHGQEIPLLVTFSFCEGCKPTLWEEGVPFNIDIVSIIYKNIMVNNYKNSFKDAILKELTLTYQRNKSGKTW